MCGIAGISLRQGLGNLPEVLKGMSTRLGHRGPDDDGLVLGNAGLSGVAHRRLSIIDLSANARQPLLNEDGTLALVCNGEIYNHRELRVELERKGHRFTSNTDSEVILHLFEDIGENSVNQLEGMFAFAILNLVTGDCFCARDPFGKKPFYYARTEAGVVFASEIPAFQDVPQLSFDLDAQALALYLLRNLRHIPDPLTVYKDIRTLPPGCFMRVSRGTIVKMDRYWRPDFTSRKVTPQEVLKAFDCAVEKRKVADVEISALLSGGVDSTAIVDSLHRKGIKGIRTFAFGMDQNDEEIARARFAADYLGTQHTEIFFDAERQHDLFEDLIVRHGQPVAALPLTHAMMLFDEIQKADVKVVMAGHGADEVFYGYDGGKSLAKFSWWQDRLPRSIANIFASAASPFMGTGPLGDALRVMKNQPGHRKAALYAAESERVWPNLFNESIPSQRAELWASGWFEDGAPTSYIDEAAYLGLMQENAHAITIAGDLPAMAHGIEVRCPFLDRKLVELGLSIPYTDKVGPLGGKSILKKALEERLPAQVLKAPKRGFGYFVQEEQVLRGVWRDRLDATFADPHDGGGILNLDSLNTLKRRFDEHDAQVPPILMAKLYALQRFLKMGALGA